MELTLLWAMTLINTIGIVLILRQMATGLPATQRTGPDVGSTLPAWSLPNLDGRVFNSSELPPSYLLVFVSTNCMSCRDLFGDLARRPSVDTRGRAYLISMGESAVIREATRDVPSDYFRETLSGASQELLHKLQVPATPYAIAVRDGKVVASKAATNRGWLLKELIDRSVTPDQDSRSLTRLPKGSN